MIAVLNLGLGLWFLFRHPITFIKFVDHYKRFASKIDEREEINQAIVESGLNRSERRAFERNARKARKVHA